MDYHGVKVKQVMLNGQPIEIKFQKHKIQLPKLSEGEHDVVVHFENTYVNNSAGLHKFTDPADG